MINCHICNIKLKSNKSLSRHLTLTHPTISKLEYYIKYLMKHSNEQFCKTCNKNTSFISLDKGFREYCSRKCSNKNYNKIKKTEINNKLKYGTSCVLKNKNIINKIKETNIKKYGVENVFSSKEIQKKIRNTNLIKYGVEYSSENSTIHAKTIKSQRINNFKKLISSEKIIKYVRPLFDINEYKGVDINNKYKFQCLHCQNIFFDHLDNNRIPRCYICFPKQYNFSFTSTYEEELKTFLETIVDPTHIIQSDRNIISPLEIDLLLLNYKLAIEFNGLYWHSELQGKDKNYHLNKTKLCDSKGIQLIHIFEDEWIDKSDIIKSMLLNKLGLIPNRIFARKCEIKEVSSKDSKQFLESNHIQGYINSKYKLGLYYENELVSLLTIGSSRFNKKYNYEIHRYCSKINTNVIGGFSKLLKNFRSNNLGSIITYADLRYGTGDVYLKNGFNFLHTSDPNYFYIKSQKRYSRNKFQKHKLPNLLESFDKILTEWENMQLNGYDRIWDCGNNVYELL